jgi:hypothetical protein
MPTTERYLKSVDAYFEKVLLCFAEQAGPTFYFLGYFYFLLHRSSIILQINHRGKHTKTKKLNIFSDMRKYPLPPLPLYHTNSFVLNPGQRESEFGVLFRNGKESRL